MIVLSAEQMEYLEHNLTFWKELDSQQKRMVLDSIRVVHLAKGTQLVRSSSECNGLILLKEGQIRAFISSDEGREVALYRILPDASCIMTAACMLKNVRFQIYLEVEKDAEMFVIPQAIFIRLNTENISVKDFTIGQLADRFSEVITIVERMVFESIPARLASFLLEQSGLNESDNLVLTHDEIAKNIGTAREVVSRSLKSFENQGLVNLSRGRILIIDKKHLYNLTVS